MDASKGAAVGSASSPDNASATQAAAGAAAATVETTTPPEVSGENAANGTATLADHPGATRFVVEHDSKTLEAHTDPAVAGCFDALLESVREQAQAQEAHRVATIVYNDVDLESDEHLRHALEDWEKRVKDADKQTFHNATAALTQFLPAGGESPDDTPYSVLNLAMSDSQVQRAMEALLVAWKFATDSTYARSDEGFSTTVLRSLCGLAASRYSCVRNAAVAVISTLLGHSKHVPTLVHACVVEAVATGLKHYYQRQASQGADSSEACVAALTGSAAQLRDAVSAPPYPSRVAHVLASLGVQRVGVAKLLEPASIGLLVRLACDANSDVAALHTLARVCSSPRLAVVVASQLAAHGGVGALLQAASGSVHARQALASCIVALARVAPLLLAPAAAYDVIAQLHAESCAAQSAEAAGEQAAAGEGTCAVTPSLHQLHLALAVWAHAGHAPCLTVEATPSYLVPHDAVLSALPAGVDDNLGERAAHLLRLLAPALGAAASETTRIADAGFAALSSMLGDATGVSLAAKGQAHTAAMRFLKEGPAVDGDHMLHPLSCLQAMLLHASPQEQRAVSCVLRVVRFVGGGYVAALHSHVAWSCVPCASSIVHPWTSSCTRCSPPLRLTQCLRRPRLSECLHRRCIWCTIHLKGPCELVMHMPGLRPMHCVSWMPDC